MDPATLRLVSRELLKLSESPPDGVRLAQEPDDLTQVEADIFGAEGTPYERGVFRCKLVIGADYPATPPKAFFTTKIFHPNVSTSGAICVNTLKREWKSDYGIGHIFQVIRCLLIVPFPESALNEDASKLFLESYDEYAKRARLFTSLYATSTSASTSTSSNSTLSSSSSSSSSSSAAAATGAAPDPNPAKLQRKQNQTMDNAENVPNDVPHHSGVATGRTSPVMVSAPGAISMKTLPGSVAHPRPLQAPSAARKKGTKSKQSLKRL